MNLKENPIPSIPLVEKKYSLPEKKDYFSFRRSEYFSLDEMEKDYSNLDSSRKSHLEKQLRERYRFRGFEQEDIENYLIALSGNNRKICQSIYFKTGTRFEKAGRLVIAAENYYEAGQYQNAAATLVKAGHQGFGRSPEFIWAADCLVQAGIPKQEAYLTISQEIKKFIKEKSNKGAFFDLESIRYLLGECLHRADQREEALGVFMRAEQEKADKLLAGKKYCVRIENWEKAAKFLKKLIENHYFNGADDYLELATYYRKAGLKKEEAQTFWSGRYFLEGAKIAFEITQDKKFFLKAAEAYNKIRPRRQAYFVNRVWEYFSKGCHEISYSSSLKENKKERLNRFHELLTDVFSAYSLPLPPKVESEPGQTAKDHKEILTRIGLEVSRKKKAAKKSEIKEIFLNSDIAGAMEHGVLGNVSLWEIEDYTKEAFKGISCPKPIESNLTSGAQKLWQKAIEEELEAIGYDPVEMAGRAYEEGSFYKEAKERYLKAGLLDDAKRMEEKIKLEKI